MEERAHAGCCLGCGFRCAGQCGIGLIHGNIVQFESPDGYEHIGVGDYSEGYIACYTAPGTGSRQAVDTGGLDNGVFGAAVVGGSSISRSTDGPAGDGGKVQLRQSYAFGPGDRRSGSRTG
jgi:hypothetical protein